MKKISLSQEGLKLIACASMLLDHLGAVVLPCKILRIIGRLAFPIYCFLLVEGFYHTRNPKHYGIRLLIAALLSEIPYDLVFYETFTWLYQNVMLTLLLGFGMLHVMKKCPNLGWKILAVLPFAAAAGFLHTDYGYKGIFLIALFFLTQELPYRALWQFLGIWCIFSPSHLMMLNWVSKFSVSVMELAALAVVPIAFYDGSKATRSKAVQWVFYLFYPVHLLLLYLIGRF